MADALNLTLASLPLSSSGLAITNQVLAVSLPRYAVMFSMPRAETITHLGYRQGVTTGTPGTNNFRATLMDLDSSGLPNADIGSTATTFTPTGGDDGTWKWITLANSYAATRGQYLASVFDTVSADNSHNISIWQYDTQFYTNGLPYYATHNGSAWSKVSTTARAPIWGLKCSSGNVYGTPVASSTTSTTNTSGNRVAAKFTLPAGWGSTFKVLGFRVRTTAPQASGTFGVGIWNAAGTLLQGATGYDSDYSASPSAPNLNLTYYFTDTTLATLDFGTAYYIGLQSAGTHVRMSTFDLAASGDAVALPLGGNVCLSTWNGSAWSDTATAIPAIDLILDDITEPSGGSGGPVMLVNGGLVQ